MTPSLARMFAFERRRLTGGEAGLIAQALKHWGIDLYEVSDTSIPNHRLPLPKVAEIHLA